MTEPTRSPPDPGEGYILREPAFSILRSALVPGTTVLDIGCGYGNVGRYLSAAGVSVDGIEPDEVRALAADARLRHVAHCGLASATNDPELGHGYDVVTLLDVVEHFMEPALALGTARDFLAPSGRLFLFVPNSAHWSFRLKILRGNWAYHDSGLFDRTHVRFFDLTTSVELFEQAGFVELNRWYTSPSSGRATQTAVQRLPNLYALHFLFELQAR